MPYKNNSEPQRCLPDHLYCYQSSGTSAPSIFKSLHRDIADDFHGNGTRLLDWESFDFKCNLHQNYLLPGKADHTQPSLGFRTVFVKLLPLVLLRLLKLLLLLILIQGFRAYKLWHQATEISSIFPLTIKVNSVHHPKAAFSISPKEGTAAAPIHVIQCSLEKF